MGKDLGVITSIRGLLLSKRLFTKLDLVVNLMFIIMTKGYYWNVLL